MSCSSGTAYSDSPQPPAGSSTGPCATLLLRWHAGERRLWAVLTAPTKEQEDARRTDGELDRLTGERTAHLNCIGSLLVMHNLRPGRIGGRAWDQWWNGRAQDVPPALRDEIARELERLALVKRQ